MRDEVDEAMFLCKATRPDACAEMLEGLRLAETYEWIAHDCLDEIEEAKSYATLFVDPVSKVLAKFLLED